MTAKLQGGKSESQHVEKLSELEINQVRVRSKADTTAEDSDTARSAVNVRDDTDDAFTFRSITLGTILAAAGSALDQVYVFKPAQTSISPVLLLVITYAAGNAWHRIFPKTGMVQGTRFEKWAPIIRFINPGPFGLKEHVITTMLPSTATYVCGTSGNSSVLIFAVQKLYYNTNVKATTAVLATFSTAFFGFGLVGVLRPLIVYPSEMVYWTSLPTVVTFQTLHFGTEDYTKRSALFWRVFIGMFIYEIVPAYTFPLLNGISVACLASQNASKERLDFITNLFGGTNANEGLGFLSLSFDWQYIGSGAMIFPLIQQANALIGYLLCYIILMVIFYANAWNSQALPMISTALFSPNGTVYPLPAVIGDDFRLNKSELEIIGLPVITGSNLWSKISANLSIGSLIAHVVLFWGPHAVESFRLASCREQPDPHYQAMLKYQEAPWWWYFILLVLSFFSGLIVTFKGETTLPWWAYILALVFGAFITPLSGLLYARMGNGIATGQLMKMLAGAVNPGKPVANLYFLMWSHDVISTALHLAENLKTGHYLKIPPRPLFLTNIWGVIVGALVHYAVMNSVVKNQRDILLSPMGTNIWSGQATQDLNSAAVTWSLTKKLYSTSGPYWIVPMSLPLGALPTLIQWCIHKRRPKIGPVTVNKIILPIIFMYSGWLAGGVNSPYTSAIIVGLVSQIWIKRYHLRWYQRYNYILGGALDGGSQTMIVLLSFAVFGASGKPRPFPAWFGNPGKGNIDHCNGNSAL